MSRLHGEIPAIAAGQSRILTDWRPDDPVFWSRSGKRIANRNLWISAPNLLLSFSIWMVWSIVAAKLKAIGFEFTADQLFWLTALPSLTGATLRIAYSFVVPVFGGRLWTTLSTLSLLAPAIGIGLAVQNPHTSYARFVVLALLCGLGGGNFASSMSNISFYFPKASKGNALAINAGVGNLGVSVMQFVAPLAITFGAFSALVGSPQVAVDNGVRSQIWLQNAGFVWAPFILAAAIAAWIGMGDLCIAKASFSSQAVVFKRPHTWATSYLYLGVFGSFIGFSAAFPLLTEILFPDVNTLQIAFLGPLVGSLSRMSTGWLSDRYGGEHVTQIAFLALSAGVLSVLHSVGAFGAAPSFQWFFASFIWLFIWTGIGNASTFQMIPAIVQAHLPQLDWPAAADTQARLKAAEIESAAIIGLSSAIGAYGGFFIPKAFSDSLKATGNPQAALFVFLTFYLSCAAVNWAFYARRASPLHAQLPDGVEGRAER